MQIRNRLPRFALILTLLITLCAGIFTPSAVMVEAKPNKAIDELNIFISEFRMRGPNGADDEFVEIYNASGGNVDIGDWIIQKSSGCGATETTLTTIPNGTTLAPGQYYLVVKDGSYSGSTPYDRSYTVSGIADDGGIALKDDSSPNRVTIDQVGLCADTTFKEGTPLSSMSGTSNQSYERKTGGSAGSCKDTDNNVADFLLTSPSNLQNFSSAAVPCLAVVNVTSSVYTPPNPPTIYLDTSGAVIDIQLEFSNVVMVTGSPTLLMETGSTDRTAVFTGGSGTNTLTFNYTIQSGDNTNDFDYTAYNALSLNGGTIIGATGDATLILPKPGNPGSLSANEEIRIDNGSVDPALLSFTRQNPSSQYTNADTIIFRITFSDAMLNVDMADFKVTGTTGTPTLIRIENGRYYDVSITGGDLTNLDDTVVLSLNSAQNITNVGGIPLPNVAPAIVESYIVDNTPPSIFFIRQTATQPDHADTLPINFDVAFDEAINPSTFTTADIRQNGTSTGITWTISNSGDNQNFVLTATSTGAGTLAPSIDANRVQDLAGNGNNVFSIPPCPDMPAPNDHCVTFNDSTRPTVTVNQATGQIDPTSALPINFMVQFSEPINTATFTTADITQNGTATGTVWSIVNSGNNMTFTLSVTASGYGTLIPSIAANRVLDLSGNNNLVSTASDNSVTFAAVNARSVIINEVAWAGTTSSLTGDEWIELYNTTNATINITGWTLKAADGTPSITLNGTIPAGGYFLLERDDDTTVSDIPADQVYTGDLSNSGEALSLRDGSGTVIDTANGNGGSWPKGSSSTYETMERIGTSTESDSSWLTNTNVKRNGKNANNGDIFGTPKSANSQASTPTPSPTPVPTSTPIPAPVVIPPRPILNEALARPGFDWNQDGRIDTFDEFIEIKNIAPADLNLSGWRLDDGLNEGSNPYVLPDITLRPGQRVALYASQTNILLSDGGDTVRLIDPSGRVYDIFTYSIARTADRSFCRLPDGAPTDSAWADDCIPTPNLANTREGMVPVMPGGNPESPVCQLPDTIPADFLLAECHGYGANIWNSYYWDQYGWQGRRYLPDNLSKWESFIE